MTAADQPIAVVGAGPAGCIVAALLAKGGADVALVDDGRPSPDRVEMLPPAAIAAFRQAGIGEAIDDGGVATRCLGIVRPGGRILEDFTAAPGGRAFAVHRQALDARLKSLARALGATVRRGRLVGFEGATGSRLVLRTAAGNERLDAACVVDATGRVASVGRRRGARSSVLQKLAASRLPPGSDPGGWLAIDHDDAGWDYTLAGPGRRVDRWRVTVGARERGTPGSAVDASARMVVPAAGRGWIAIGDASAAFDPVCCQGLAHAAGTALAAAGIILARGTICSEAARGYDAACRATAERTEAARRRVYAGMAAERRDAPETSHRTEGGERECAMSA